MGELGDQLVVVEIPLLDARRRDEYGFDVVVLVETSPEVAVRRAAGRGMTEDEARARTAAQPTAQQRRQVADRTLANDGTQAELEAAVEALWAWLRSQAHTPRLAGALPSQPPSTMGRCPPSRSSRSGRRPATRPRP